MKKDRGRAYAGGNGTACGTPPEKSRTAQGVARKAESRTAKDKDAQRTCRRPKRGGSPNAGGIGTSGSPQEPEENRKGKAGTASRNRPGSGGRAGTEAGVSIRSHQEIPAENV